MIDFYYLFNLSNQNNFSPDRADVEVKTLENICLQAYFSFQSMRFIDLLL